MTTRLAVLALLWWCLSTPLDTDAPRLEGPFVDEGARRRYREATAGAQITTACWYWTKEGGT